MDTVGVVRRGPEHQDSDVAATIDRLKDGAWRWWPNRAGFEGLVEHRGPIRLRVCGEIPPWAAGSLFRTGPGQSVVEGTVRGTHYVSHWFDGFAHTHRFDIVEEEDDNGKRTVAVVYSSRRQSDAHVEHIRREGWRSSTSFGQRADPCIGIFAKLMSFFIPRRINTNVVCNPNYPGLPRTAPDRSDPAAPSTLASDRTGVSSIFISTDHCSMQEISPDTLEPLGFTNQQGLHPHLSGPMSCAHSQRDPVTGDVFNYNLALGRVATYRVFRVNAADGSTDILATLSEPDIPPAYMHSFFLTENFVVLCIPCAHFAWNGLKILWRRNILDAIKPFDPQQSCIWLVVDRRHGRGLVCRFTTPAAFYFHTVNAFEERVKEDGDDEATVHLNLDAVFYDNTDVIFALYYDVILDRDDAMANFVRDGRFLTARNRLVRHRFRMPKATDPPSQAEEIFSIPNPHSGELSSINPAYAGRRHRYVFGTSTRGLSTLMDTIVKTDLDTRQVLFWAGPWGHTPGEPVFVARPGATAEDDGVLLSVVLDGAAKKSYLLCLDARTLVEMGRAETDFAIAIGFHGFHAPVLKA
ncbi:hypothetical protein CDD80_4184 [Ophiocordyceps camponoti-rufipedis]|uniref:Dioxygenase n=1 Tax=Ophiocordyceps camponoti-rufipedis TaxID=2004952 RepID=A0A2C5Y486_9HYPO|nr:hypothetical protein CDD80_4184 [Ophiocordyceps camponoti-rufipedis]